MKKLILFLFCAALAVQSQAQTYDNYDSLRRHEIGVSVLPVLVFVSGGRDISPNANFSFAYRYYGKKGIVFRTSFLAFVRGSNDYLEGIPQYDRTVPNGNIFRVHYYGNGTKTQLSFGLEKIFRVKRWMHGFGAEIGFNHQFIQVNEGYYFSPFYINTPSNGYTGALIDTLGSRMTGTRVGVALQLFYSLHYKISKHWYVSATVGPSMNFSQEQGSIHDRRTDRTYNISNFDFNIPNVPLISDVSFCFRF